MKLLAPDAALALVALEKDTGGLVYGDMWRDGMMNLLVRRSNRAVPLPGYCGHNYGIAIDLDIGTILEEKKILYEDLLHLMKKRGWVCLRRDGERNKPGSEHFVFLGDQASRYLARCTMDPITWVVPTEMIIMEKYGTCFDLDVAGVQELLTRLSIYVGPITGQKDAYTREAILTFQRAWDLTQSGSVDMMLCRALAFISAEREVVPLPSWAV